MTDSARYLPPNVRRRIEDHLDQVDLALQRRSTAGPQRRHIIEELRAHIDEMLFAGFLRHKAVDLVKCKTNDILVPADAEIVLEGYVDPHERQPEGPFGCRWSCT